MGGWGPRTPEQHRQAKEEARIWQAEKPWRDKVAQLEKRIAQQDRIINLLKKHIKKHGGDGLVLELLEELVEED